jgi:hypothetical protein
MKNILMSLRDWLKGLFSDEKGTASSKRFVGVVCALTLCATLYHNSFSSTDIAPSGNLVDAVALLAFGCLGLTSIDKFVAAKQPKTDKIEE